MAKLSFSPYLPNLPLLPTFMGPLHCFVFFLDDDCGKIVIFAIFVVAGQQSADKMAAYFFALEEIVVNLSLVFCSV